jgi:predicted NUDIX family phosphoesterase
MSEKIIVLREKDLFKKTNHSENFFSHSKKNIIKNILLSSTEYEKELAENDMNYKQIVAYILFSYKKKLFLMQRQKTTNELSLKYFLGIGGHLRKEDIKKNVSSWGKRELDEEVCLKKGFKTKLIGFINDNSNLIGKKHFGIIYLIKGKSADISISSEIMAGKMIEIKDLKEMIPYLESWSSIIAKELLKKDKSTRS